MSARFRLTLLASVVAAAVACASTPTTPECASCEERARSAAETRALLVGAWAPSGGDMNFVYAFKRDVVLLEMTMAEHPYTLDGKTITVVNSAADASQMLQMTIVRVTATELVVTFGDTEETFVRLTPPPPK